MDVNKFMKSIIFWGESV